MNIKQEVKPVKRGQCGARTVASLDDAKEALRQQREFAMRLLRASKDFRGGAK